MPFRDVPIPEVLSTGQHGIRLRTEHGASARATASGGKAGFDLAARMERFGFGRLKILPSLYLTLRLLGRSLRLQHFLPPPSTN